MSGSATQAPKATETEAERIARMEREVREYRAAQRQRVEDTADQQLKPIADLAKTPAFNEILEKSKEARDKAVTFPEIFNLLNSMITIMEHVPGATERARQAFIQREQAANEPPASPTV